MSADDRSPLEPRGSAAPTPDRSSGASAFVWLGTAIAVLTAIATLLPDEDVEEDAPAASASAAGSAGPVPRPPRCERVAPEESFVLGQAPTRGADAKVELPPGIPGLDAPASDEIEEDAAPFAVILGRGVATKEGFAFGALRDGEGGSVAIVGKMGPEGRGGGIVRLARSRGDVEAPVVAAAPDGALLVALLEPNAGGRALRLARVVGDQVTWGAELSQGTDESLALDLAVSGERALVAWDDAARDGAQVVVSALSPKDPSTATPPRVVSPKSTSADTPRLAPRAGGFWLAWVARGEEARRAERPREGVDELGDDEIDEESGGERIETSWVEVVPLDENGAPTGGPARVSPREGTVLGFDLAPGADGGAVVAWRADASPTGGGGGTVQVAYVGPGGVGEVRPIVDEDVDDGIPDLLGLAGGAGWIAVSSIRGSQAIGRIDDRGQVIGPVAVEPSLGRGEAVAASGDRLVLATPEGRAMRLRVVRCAEAAAPSAPDPAAPPPAD